MSNVIMHVNNLPVLNSNNWSSVITGWLFSSESGKVTPVC